MELTHKTKISVHTRNPTTDRLQSESHLAATANPDQKRRHERYLAASHQIRTDPWFEYLNHTYTCE